MNIPAIFTRTKPLNYNDYRYFSMLSGGRDLSYLKKATDNKYDKYIMINGLLDYTDCHRLEKLKPAMANYAKATGTAFELKPWTNDIGSDDLLVIERKKTGSSKIKVLSNISAEKDSDFARKLFQILEDIVKETKKIKLTKI